MLYMEEIKIKCSFLPKLPFVCSFILKNEKCLYCGNLLQKLQNSTPPPRFSEGGAKPRPQFLWFFRESPTKYICLSVSSSLCVTSMASVAGGPSSCAVAQSRNVGGGFGRRRLSHGHAFHLSLFFVPRGSAFGHVRRHRGRLTFLFILLLNHATLDPFANSVLFVCSVYIDLDSTFGQRIKKFSFLFGARMEGIHGWTDPVLQIQFDVCATFRCGPVQPPVVHVPEIENNYNIL